MQSEISRVLSEYTTAKSEPLAKHPFAAWFQSLKQSLPAQVPELERLRIVTSTGVGNWAAVPWIAALRNDLAPSPQDGLYLVYLFRGDMSGVVLSLNQGVTNVSARSSGSKRLALKTRVDEFRKLVAVPERFQETNIALAAETPLGKSYEQGHIWGITYEANALPDDETLKRDLAELANIYNSIDAAAALPILSPATISTLPGTEVRSTLDDPLVRAIEAALQYKRQVVLFGPPGTGKTHIAWNFANSFLARDLSSPESSSSDSDAEVTGDNAHQRTAHAARAWWAVANPTEWRWETIFSQPTQDYRRGRLQRNYADIRVGDLVFGYESTPTKRIVALARVTVPSAQAANGDFGFTLEPLARVQNGPSYEAMKADPVLSQSEPMRFRSQGTLFALSPTEQDVLSSLVLDSNPDLEKYLEATSSGETPPLSFCTFHASYSYEDFVEGYRPLATSGSSLQLSLEDGIFKRICDTAKANPKRPYLLIIDELNRANVSKVFGELITILELDKRERGLEVILPQSRRQFSIPTNVYIIATMNTADRSIALLDIALRRRFAFIELMPNYDLLEGVVVEQLDLALFLNDLNRRISEEFGREKQIGHAFLLADGAAVNTSAALLERFRFEIFPLIQELAYADHLAVGRILGNDFLTPSGDFRQGLLDDSRLLFDALRLSFPDALRS
jgi:hypothetical protein